MSARDAVDWPADIHAALSEAGLRQIAYVPDAGHARLIRLCAADAKMRMVPLTTEEEGVALAAGAWLGGERAVLLMQSSGVGNCINMLGMMEACRFPLLMIVTMRGEFGEFNPWQVPMGRATPGVLEQANVIVHRASEAASVGAVVAGAARLAFSSYQSVAVLLSQRLVGAKSFQK
ncbi:MAG TPA: thiamine pyrophosphate-binding protein [Stellaceae bacterium]|nr:thiamine pyrophosphate-binding protein [Stellaceae bacterium]